MIQRPVYLGANNFMKPVFAIPACCALSVVVALSDDEVDTKTDYPFRSQGTYVDARGRTVERRVLDVGTLVERHWFGSATSTDGETRITLSRGDSLVTGIQELVNSRIGQKIKGVSMGSGLPNQPITSFSKAPQGGYRITLLTTPSSEGMLAERVLAFILLILSVSNAENVDETLERLKSGEIDSIDAVERLLMNDYKTFLDAGTFGKVTWKPWRIANDLPASADEGWRLTRDELGTFEEWLRGDYGTRRRQHWGSIVENFNQ